MPILIRNRPEHDNLFVPMLYCDICSAVIENSKTAWVLYPDTKGDHVPQFVHCECLSPEAIQDPEIASCDLEGFFPMLNINCDLENTGAGDPALN